MAKEARSKAQPKSQSKDKSKGHSKTHPKKGEQSEFIMPIVDVLLESPSYAFDHFAEQFQKKWMVTIGPHREENAMGIMVDGRVVGCTLVPSPVKDTGVMQEAKDNELWPDAEDRVLAHKAHLRVTLTREGDPVAAHVIITKVICSLLQQKNVVGVYLRPGLYEPAYYTKCAESLMTKKLPTELWVNVNSLDAGSSGFSFYTSGMEKFGKSEFEIVDSTKNFIDSLYFLKGLVQTTLEKNIKYKDGDTVGDESGSKVKLSVSKGVKIKGTTIKIDM